MSDFGQIICRFFIRGIIPETFAPRTLRGMPARAFPRKGFYK